MRQSLTQLLPRLEASCSALLQRQTGAACTSQFVLSGLGQRTFADAADLKKTPLHAFHVENGGTRCLFLRALISTACEKHVALPPSMPIICATQGKWCRSPAGLCPSNTKRASWIPVYTAERTLLFSMSRICAELVSGCAQCPVRLATYVVVAVDT